MLFMENTSENLNFSQSTWFVSDRNYCSCYLLAYMSGASIPYLTVVSSINQFGKCLKTVKIKSKKKKIFFHKHEVGQQDIAPAQLPGNNSVTYYLCWILSKIWWESE